MNYYHDEVAGVVVCPSVRLSLCFLSVWIRYTPSRKMACSSANCNTMVPMYVSIQIVLEVKVKIKVEVKGVARYGHSSDFTNVASPG